MDKNTQKVNVTVEKLPKSIVKLTIVASEEDMPKAIDKAYNRLSNNVEVKGFRKGAAPKHLIVQALGEKLYEEAFNVMMWSLSDKALAQEKLVPLSQPEYSILELDPAKPFSFSMQFAVYPEVVIGDLKEIKVDKKEVEKAVEAREKIKNGETSTEEENVEEQKDETEEVNEGETKEEAEKPKESVFSLEEYYSKILDDVFAASQIDVPEAIVERELNEHIHSFSHRLQDLGINTEDFLKLQNLTLEDAKANWRKDIEFSLKQDLLLSKYAADKNITATDEEVKESLATVYKPEEIEKLDPQMYDYVRNAIVRQKAFLDLITSIENN